MKTVVRPDDVAGRAEAVRVLRAGGLVSMPTDTVYGVGVALTAPDGLERLFAAKDRPLDKAIVLLVADPEQVASVGAMTPVARALAERFWPGGLTLVLAQAPAARLPSVLTAGQSTIGVRIPDHDSPRALAAQLGPLPVTSANISGQPAATTADEVMAQLGGRIDLVLDGGRTAGGVPSTVIDCSTDPPRVLREGAVAIEDLFDELQMIFAGSTGDILRAGALAVRSIGLDIAVEAARRLAEREDYVSDADALAYGDLLREGDAQRLGQFHQEHGFFRNDPDIWVVGVGLDLAEADPELGWQFVCRLADAVSEDHLCDVGAGPLEDFCNGAGAAYIEQIERRAATSDRFRLALDCVWPSGIPIEIYGRLRAAAGFPLTREQEQAIVQSRNKASEGQAKRKRPSKRVRR